MYSIVDLLVIGSFLLLASIIADFFGACNTVDFSRDATDLLHERPCRLLASAAQTQSNAVCIKLVHRLKGRQVQPRSIHAAPQRGHIQTALGDKLYK